MKKTYKQVLDEIEALQNEAESIRRKEVEAVIARIREAISFYQLTAEDLGFAAAPSYKSSVRQRSSDRPPKYRDDQGNVWSGRGPRPKWMREAIAAGRRKEDFALRS
ncbi:MAG: H-NS histone family protein [Ramlibacter sp.]|nr:H-NS histone family protein [Ramlibacter sp.]